MRVARVQHAGGWAIAVDRGDGWRIAPDLDPTDGPAAVGQLASGAFELGDPIGAPQLAFGAPLIRPGKIIAVGLNYADHIRETGTTAPERPILFAKFASALTGPYDPIVIDPELTDQGDYEVELAVVIGRPTRRATQDDALDSVFGYTVANDVSAREWQKRDVQLTRSKSMDSFCPVGPWITSADEVPDPNALGAPSCRRRAGVLPLHIRYSDPRSTRSSIPGITTAGGRSVMARRATLCVLSLVLLAGCTGDGGGASAQPGDGDEPAGEWEITALMPNPSAVNVFNLCAAIGEGYMAEEGITVNFEAVDGSGPVLQAMVAGQAEIGLPGPGPLLNARVRGEAPVMFYNHFAQALFGLVVPADSDIQAPADLTGTVIGVGTAEGAEVSFARAILADAGLEEDTDYEFLPVGDGGPATAAFEREEIVAYAAAIPDMAIIEARGLPLREITPEQFLAFFGNGYAALQSTIDEDPELIAGFTRALLRGFEFAEANKDATLEHCTELNPEEGADTELTTALYDAVLARAQPLGGLEVGLFAADAWQTWHDTLIESGELEEPIDDLDAAWTNEFVEQAQE